MNEPVTPLSASPTGIVLRRIQLLVLACCYGLLVYFMVSSILAINSFSFSTLVIWLIQTIPLLIFMPGMHKQHLRSFAWVSFVVLLYFMHGVLVAFDPGRLVFGLIEVGLCSLLFVFLILYIRQYRLHFGVGLQ